MISDHVKDTLIDNTPLCSCCGNTIKYGETTEFDYDNELIICSFCKSPVD